MRINLTTPMSDDKERQRRNEAVLDAIERHTEERMNDAYGRIHTDGSRSGGQPLIANRKAHTMIIEVLAAWGIEPSNTTPEQLTIATTEALCRAIKQIEDLRQPIQSSVAAAPADRIGGGGGLPFGVVGAATQNDALKAENERLREHLISALDTLKDAEVCDDNCGPCNEARAALEQSK